MMMTSSTRRFRSSASKYSSQCTPMEISFSVAVRQQQFRSWQSREIRAPTHVISTWRHWHFRLSYTVLIHTIEVYVKSFFQCCSAWRGLSCPWPETASRWRHQHGGVECPNFSWFERRLDGVDRTRLCCSSRKKTILHRLQWSTVLTGIAEPEVSMTSYGYGVGRFVLGGAVPEFHAVRTHYRSSRLELLLLRKTDFHWCSLRGFWSAWPETASRWRHQHGGVGCPHFSWLERRLVWFRRRWSDALILSSSKMWLLFEQWRSIANVQYPNVQYTSWCEGL